MAWPTPQDYNEAIQNPRQNCADLELADGAPTLTPLGLPRPITGNFASVYRVHAAARDWAVRCFWREYQDMPVRYAAISRQLQQARLPYTVGFEYLERGIRIRGAWYPLLKMEWVEGELLHTYLARNLGDAAALKSLAEQWLEMAASLETAGIAHGDLQHGNVLVVGGRLKLVDYDGMFVPALAGRGSHELGHQHFQHPRRDAGVFAPWMDRCSVWVIYLSIGALAVRPELWTLLGAGEEHLLFRRADLEQPDTSAAFQALDGLPDEHVRRLATIFRGSLSGSLAAMPSLVSAIRSPRPAPVMAGAGGTLRQLWSGAPVEPDHPASSAVVAASPLVPASHPAWLADHIVVAPLHTFSGPREVPRISLLVAILGLATVVFLTAGGVLPLLIALVASLTIASVAGVFLTVSYRADPTVTARREIEHRRREASHELAALDAAIHDCCREIERRRQALEHERTRTERHKTRLLVREQRERESARQERDLLIREFQEELDTLNLRERAEIDRLLEEQRTRHVQAFLRSRTLRAATLPDIPALIKVRLWTTGVRTAADVTQERMEAIGRLGKEVARSLSRWRVDLELEARRTTPSTLPVGVLGRLTEIYGRERTQLGAQQLQCEEREQSLADSIGRRFREKHLPLDRTLAEETAACAAALPALERRIRTLQAERGLPAAHLARIQRELEPYAGVNPSRYLIALISLEDRD